MRILPTRYRYPLFFIGILMMSSAGFIYRYARIGTGATAAMVAAGFLLFVLSLALP